VNKDTVRLELAIGFFIVAGIITIMGMVVYMTGGVSLVDDTYLVVVDIDNIGDLKTGAPVKLGGVQIGNVKNISIADDDIQLVAGIDRKYKLRADCRASIATSGLVGDSFLDISRGKDRKYLYADATDIKDAPHISGISQAGMGELLSQVQKIGAQVEELVININKVVGKEEFRKNIEESVANVNSTTAEARDLLAGLRKDLVEVDRAVASVANVAQAAEKTMDKVNFFVDKTIGNPEKVEEINTTIENIKTITTSLSENRNYIINTIKQVDKTTSNLARITDGIDPNQGLLRLLTDQQAGNDILLTLKNLQKTANSLATVGLTDLIADKLAADKIFEVWQKEHNFKNSAEMMAKWKEWMAMQKRVNDMIMNSPYGASSGSVCPPMSPSYR